MKYNGCWFGWLIVDWWLFEVFKNTGIAYKRRYHAEISLDSLGRNHGYIKGHEHDVYDHEHVGLVS